ncbi:hypothetical protein SAMN02745148_01650 [Modicisalibacter ilicicola DSM 19980]|uniref:Pre-peptidase C-terminal domain-containing protein n=1 Tax=Modicisalibacter ilicicola DSM 19980 TaxID=1121942 RepID=A0A1M4YBE8_9GAMM|nr:hypothetical protein [Halomonas ilicicola]SHF02989.1 hypothetical protein SAMN02745148_01650 [Halomonas ilicicola DSM 19980]
MKYRAFPIVVALGLSGAALPALADSPALQRAEKAAAEVDLSRFFTSRTDARSQSFGFGGTHEHPFSVENAGRYVFTSSTFPGESVDYRIEAALLDARGNVVASGKGLGQNGGLRLVEELEPGDYVLRVSANKFGSEASGGNRFNVEVAGLDASGRRLDSDASGIDSGSGIQFGGPGRDGRTTAFVDKNDDVAAIAAPRTGGTAAESRSKAADSEASAPVFGDQPESLSSQRQSALDVPSPRNTATEAGSEAATDEAARGAGASEQAMPDAFDEIVADIDIRAKGEVLSFDVVEAGTVSITSSTFVGSETSYRLEARVLDENGNVVASDKAKGFEGDFDIETRLQPGRYTIWVNGQKFGSANSGVNNYTLRVQQLDTQ